MTEDFQLVIGEQLIPVFECFTEAIATQLAPMWASLTERIGEMWQAMERWGNVAWDDVPDQPIGPLPEGHRSAGGTFGVDDDGATYASTYPCTGGPYYRNGGWTFTYPGTQAAMLNVRAVVPREYPGWYCVVQALPEFTLVYVPVALNSGPILDDEGVPVLYRAKGEPLPTLSGYVEIMHLTMSLPEPSRHAVSSRYVAIINPTDTLKGQRATQYLEARANDDGVKGYIPHAYVTEDGPTAPRMTSVPQ